MNGYLGCQNLHVQFAIGEQVFLMSKCHILASIIVSCSGKCHIATSGVIFGVVGDMFHGTLIINGVYKVEVQGVTLRETTLFQPNFKDDLPQGCERSNHILGRPCKYAKSKFLTFRIMVFKCGVM